MGISAPQCSRFSWPLLRRLFASTGSARLVGAIAAFDRIISKSRWAKRLRKHPEVMKRGPYETSHTEDENIQRRLELRLDNEIHDKLRAGELTAWGRTNYGNPLRRIQSDEWDEIAIMFDKESLTKGSTNACAWLRDGRLAPRWSARYCMCWPPLIAILAPVTNAASSEHRQMIRPAISSGAPRRPSGICGRILVSSTSFGIAMTILVPM